MPVNKKLLIVLCLLAVVVFSAMTAMRNDPDGPGFKNLKVLPKNIPKDTLDKVMHGWAHALGVHCNFCHEKGTDNHLDFASDAKPEKNMARKMYEMAAKINKKYFKGQKNELGMVVGDIQCITCHHGSPHPDDLKNMGMDMHGGDMHHDMPPPGMKHDSVPPGGNH
jgi:hypothetical protein